MMPTGPKGPNNVLMTKPDVSARGYISPGQESKMFYVITLLPFAVDGFSFADGRCAEFADSRFGLLQALQLL
jgi:hypothetical protein